MSDATLAPKRQNKHDTRESWLRSATNALRHHFIKCGYEIPGKMRFSIGFTSKGRSGRTLGELWHPATSADGSCELFIRADLEDPADVLSVLVHQLVHSVLPIDAGHGKPFAEAMQRIGLEGKARDAVPAPLLAKMLKDIAESLGPLPHASRAIERGPDGKGRPVDRAKPQKNRMAKASCSSPGCEFTIRISPKWIAEVGLPRCPKHGLALVVDSSAIPLPAISPQAPPVAPVAKSPPLDAGTVQTTPPPAPAVPVPKSSLFGARTPPAPAPSPAAPASFTAADASRIV